MDYAYKTNQAVYELTKFNIHFCNTNESYLFKNKWTNTYTESYFKEETDKIKSLLHFQLKNGLNQKEYLQDLLDIIGKRINWLQENRVGSPNFLETYSNKISTATTVYEIPISNEDKYKKFKANDKESTSSDIEFFGFLELHSNDLGNYKNLIDFEKGILLYAIMLYRHALIDLNGYIDSIHMNADFIDFNNFKLGDIEESNLKKRKDRICHINFDKKSVAHLFRILIEEEIIVFDELNDKKNLLEMKKFVEQNFTYQNTKKERKEIEKFNREYSEISARQGLNDKTIHKEFIDGLILKLKSRKNNL